MTKEKIKKVPTSVYTSFGRGLQSQRQFANTEPITFFDVIIPQTTQKSIRFDKNFTN